MEVESLKIGGYRSLYDVALSPGHLTVLTGPNNSGKTNLVEAVDFLSEVHRHGLEVAVNRKGGIENISYRRMRRTRRAISFEVRLSFDLEEIGARGLLFGRPSERSAQVLVRHKFSIRAVSQAIEADFVIESEELEARQIRSSKSSTLVFSMSRVGDGVRIRVGRAEVSGIVEPFNLKDFKDYIKGLNTPTNLLTEIAGFNPLLRFFEESLATVRLYQLVPLECRRPGVPTPNADLDRHGSNLPGMVAYLQKHDPQAWGTILDAMRRIIPGLREVTTDFTSDRRLALQFEEEGVGRGWSSEDISDGTIQSLALFTALFNKRSPLILVEEPENSIHPWIVRNFVDACRSIKTKSVILTTHSPVLISYLQPDDVWMVWRRQGRTQVQPLSVVDPDAKRLWEEGESSLFSMLDSGVLPEAVPTDVE